VLQVTDHQPAALRPLEEVREQVRADFEADRSAKAARARAEALLARAKKGEALEALATEIGGVVQDSAGIARSAGFPDPAIATEAFRLKPLVAGEPADVGLAAMSGGRYALVVATAVKSGDLSQFSPQIRTQLPAGRDGAPGLRQGIARSVRGHGRRRAALMPVDIGTTVPTSDMKKPVATRAFSLAKDWASPWRSEAMPQWLSLSRPAMPRML
jgi:hypothetical protein